MVKHKDKPIKMKINFFTGGMLATSVNSNPTAHSGGGKNHISKHDIMKWRCVCA